MFEGEEGLETEMVSLFCASRLWWWAVIGAVWSVSGLIVTNQTQKPTQSTNRIEKPTYSTQLVWVQILMNGVISWVGESHLLTLSARLRI